MDHAMLLEANRLIKAAYASEPVPKISTPSDCWALPLLRKLGKARQESFAVITLDASHHVIRAHEITKGLVNRTVVHPREVFRAAILDNSAAIIVAHNHPSGNLEPSPEDKDITQRLKAVSDIVGIALLDHVIVSRAGYYSFAEHGIMEPAPPPAINLSPPGGALASVQPRGRGFSQSLSFGGNLWNTTYSLEPWRPERPTVKP